jgi:predicted amidohydrolase YtcJ
MKSMNPQPILVKAVLIFSFVSTLISAAAAQTGSLQDISQAAEPLPHATIFTAKEIITLDPSRPAAQAVAVVGDRILAVGNVDELKAAAGDQPFVVDETFANQVLIPGLIAQHDHPFLTSLTMMSEIIAIEDWVLPSGTVPAARDRNEYLERLTAAEAKLDDPGEPLLTWGFHHYFHGKLTRADLDKISAERPILVWHRSCHEFILNSAALDIYGVTREHVTKQSESAQEQSNLEEGHFWEQGLFGVIGLLAPAVATPERIQGGLEFMVDYFHANGVTLGCEPGGLLSKPMQDAQNGVLSNLSNPFRFYFIPDGKSLIVAHPDNAIAETEKVLDWGEGMTAMVPGQVKLFADGAIYSQAMQVREPYTDGHEGEWMMDLDVFAKAFRTYWEADYQIHVHVNGDAGLDMVLNNLEENMRRHPRHDHRTVIVHFAVSSTDQVARIKNLGAIVSANSYYPIALADQYSKSGLGPERADSMVRLGDVERAGIPFSFHSDMPMAPAQPLFLMHCAVNRITTSGRVVAPDQRVSREGALKAVTLEAAYSLQMEDDLGSISPGKLANFTVLAENPITCEPENIKDIAIWGTVHEGRVLPKKKGADNQAARPAHPRMTRPRPFALGSTLSSGKRLFNTQHSGHDNTCACATGRLLAELVFLHRSN